MDSMLKRIERVTNILKSFMSLGMSYPVLDGDVHPMKYFLKHSMANSIKDYAVEISTRVVGTIPLCDGLTLAWTHIYMEEWQVGDTGKIHFQIQGEREKFQTFTDEATEFFGRLKLEGGR